MSKFWKLLLLSTVVAILTACTDDSEVEPAEEGADGAAEGAASDEVTIAISGDVVSLDPHGSNDSASELVREILFDGLVGLTDDGEIENQLATDHTQVDDTTWEFNLREDVTFHDGSAFNAEVVKANMDRITDPIVGSERAYMFEMVEGVEVIDDYTVHITTDYPYAPIISNLAHGAGKMLSKEQIDADYENALSESGVDMTLEEYYEAREADDASLDEIGDEISGFIGAVVEENPTGTGYMQFESRNPGDNTVLARYDEYWEEPADIERATFKVVQEPGSRIAELETGASHIINDVGSENIDRIENHEEAELSATESNAVDYIGFNVESEPLDDVRVRQAISHALDREAVISGIYNGSGTPALGPLPPAMLGHDENLEGTEYDMERAEALLEEAGYADGFELTMLVNDENAERIDVGIWLQESLSDLGITLNIEQMEWGAFLEATGNGEHDMFVSGWTNVTGDPDNALAPLLHTDNIGSAGNRSYYSNEELDEMLDEGRRETDDEARGQIYTEAQELVVEEAPMIFVRFGENLNAHRGEVQDFSVTINDMFNLQNMTVE